MIDQEHGMQDSTREKIREAAQSGLVQLIMPGVMAVAMLFLGYAVNRLSDHFDRIDAHLANSDTTTTVLRRDVDDQKVQVQAQAVQLKAVQEEADHTAWMVGEWQRDTRGVRR